MIDETTKKILIVEDDESLRKILSHTLKSENLDVEEAQDGEEGLEKALSLHPDLMLLDIVLPKMDGLTLLKRLREDEWGKHASVIALTNLGDISTVSEVLEQGTSDYLIKSEWKLDDLVRKVNEKIGRM
jgi:DNA-binding response OmpR family regulator